MTVTTTSTGSLRGTRDGDVVVFRGDQRHSYRNEGREPAIAYSVVALAPAGG